jgi:hypothetical protein
MIPKPSLAYLNHNTSLANLKSSLPNLQNPISIENDLWIKNVKKGTKQEKESGMEAELVPEDEFWLEAVLSF